MRLIDADALKEYVKSWHVGEGINSRQDDFLKAIDKSPTIEEVPNLIHAKWISKRVVTKEAYGEKSRAFRYCSNCNTEYIPYATDGMNYCSICGAKMDGEVTQ